VPLLLSGSPGREREVYQATLVRPDSVTAESWVRPIRGKTFGELLAVAARDEKQLRNAQAITSYKVHRTFGETSVEYRAAIVWLVDPLSHQFEAYIVDHLTEGVDRALGDNYKPGLGRNGGLKVHQQRGLVEKSAVIDDGSPSAASCVPSSVQFSASLPAQSGAEEHNSGAHTMTIQDTFTCTCDSSCNASCSQSPYFSCSDSQDISGLNSYHQASSNVALDQTSTSDGLNVAPYCVIGYACAVRSCYSAYFCSLSVTIGWSGSGVNAGVTFTTSSGTIWSRTAKLSHTCSKCTASTPPPPTGGGGNPDNGGGSACYAGEIVTPLECVNDCNGVVSGDYCYI
jgi:hypothetical protein